MHPAYAFDAARCVDAKDGDDRGKFGEHYGRYSDIAKLVVALSGAVIAFLINLLADEKRSAAVGSLVRGMPIIVGFFGLSIAFLLAFMSFASYLYEEYCHSKSFETYTRRKYAHVSATASTGVLLFILGTVWLTVTMFG